MSIFIFRRDFRLTDNTGLNVAKKYGKITKLFILTPEQVGKNKYKSEKAVSFMLESLEGLGITIKRGDPAKVIAGMLGGIKAVVVNRDYTAYSKKRDAAIEKVCVAADVKFVSCEDIMLIPDDIGRVYQRFAPFYNLMQTKKVRKPTAERAVSSKNRKTALAKLKNPPVRGNLEEGTTEMSKYIKFGCVSIREVYAAWKDHPELVRQLFWRDFYYRIGDDKNILKVNINKKTFTWGYNEKLFIAWCEGKTGFPVVDAGMRQLNATGFMHNRARLIVANFLIWLLDIDWKKGEWYFATKLVDYDPIINNANWQWVAGTGTDYQIRVYNPWTQGERHDPNCVYIKKWVPELEYFSVRDIHKGKVPGQIIDYKNAREKAMKKLK